MKILNLYAGIGGNRYLWGDDHEIVAVEKDERIADYYQRLHKNDIVVVADAHNYLLNHYHEFDFIWSSPPCQTHSRVNKNFYHIRYADLSLYQEIIFLQTWFEGKWVVENVVPYYGQEGLRIDGVNVQRNGRHLFWCNFKIITTGRENNEKQCNVKAQKSKNNKHRELDDANALAAKLGMRVIDPKLIDKGTHAKLYRNCVHPKLGLSILNRAQNIYDKKNAKQLEIFEDM